jgi:hypothetical protein
MLVLSESLCQNVCKSYCSSITVGEVEQTKCGWTDQDCLRFVGAKSVDLTGQSEARTLFYNLNTGTIPRVTPGTCMYVVFFAGL